MIAAILTAAILSLAPWVGPARAAEIAAGPAAATSDLDEALLLVTVDYHESSLRKSVEDCRITGDGGRAVSAYQLTRRHLGRRTRAEVCASHALASKLALRALRAPQCDPRCALAAYLGRRQSDPEVSRRMQTFERLREMARAQGDS